MRLPKEPSQLMDAEDKEGYEKFKESVNTKTMELLQHQIPKRILELNRRFDITKSNSNLDDFEKAGELEVSPDREQVRKKVRLDSDAKTAAHHKIYENVMPVHRQITEVQDQLMQEFGEIADITQCIKLWIQLHVPKIEDGDNFGVAVQEQVKNELARFEDCFYTYTAATSNYRISRSKLLSKVIKYPNLEDYRIAVSELDEKHWLELKMFQMDMRNNYTIVLELLRKNWDRIVKPRNSDPSSMVF